MQFPVGQLVWKLELKGKKRWTYCQPRQVVLRRLQSVREALESIVDEAWDLRDSKAPHHLHSCRGNCHRMETVCHARIQRVVPAADTVPDSTSPDSCISNSSETSWRIRRKIPTQNDPGRFCLVYTHSQRSLLSKMFGSRHTLYTFNWKVQPGLGGACTGVLFAAVKVKWNGITL